MAQIHSWLYNSQIPEKDFVAPSSFDLRDRLNAATDPVAAFSVYAQALDASGARTRRLGRKQPMIAATPAILLRQVAANADL